MKFVFKPMGIYIFPDGNTKTIGLAVFYTQDINIDWKYFYYYLSEDNIPSFPHDKEGKEMARVVVIVEFTKDENYFIVANTHFTWTPNGMENKKQMYDLDNIFAVLNKYQDIIICGDFNAPRYGRVYKRIAQHYQDNVPKEIESTLDENLHRVKGLKRVVDYIFTSSNYKVTNIKIQDGLSDHKALIADIEKI